MPVEPAANFTRHNIPNFASAYRRCMVARVPVMAVPELSSAGNHVPSCSNAYSSAQAVAPLMSAVSMPTAISGSFTLPPYMDGK